MDKNYNINITAPTLGEAFQHCPKEDEDMLTAIGTMFSILMDPKKLKGESKKMKNRRIGYSLGLMGSMAMISEERFPATPAAMTECILKLAPSELALKNLVQASTMIINGDYNFKDAKAAKSKPEIKILDRKTGKLVDMDANDLPDDLKAALQEMVGNINEEKTDENQGS